MGGAALKEMSRAPEKVLQNLLSDTYPGCGESSKPVYQGYF